MNCFIKTFFVVLNETVLEDSLLQHRLTKYGDNENE